MGSEIYSESPNPNRVPLVPSRELALERIVNLSIINFVSSRSAWCTVSQFVKEAVLACVNKNKSIDMMEMDRPLCRTLHKLAQFND